MPDGYPEYIRLHDALLPWRSPDPSRKFRRFPTALTIVSAFLDPFILLLLPDFPKGFLNSCYPYIDLPVVPIYPMEDQMGQR